MWERWWEGPDRRRVAADTVGEQWVSTVFTRWDQRVGPGHPLMFETMVFPAADPWLDEYCARYATWAEALAGHERVVAHLQAGKPVEELNAD